MNHQDLIKELKTYKNQKKAQQLQRFFKTKKGQYGHGDIFLGVKVPLQRQIAKKFINLSLSNLQTLLNSKIHEVRLTSLLIIVLKYQKSPSEKRKKIVNLYLKNTKNINNWDLVDLSAPKILGNWLLKNPKEKKILYSLARSKIIWERRIAIISTFAFIKKDQFADSLKIANILLNDKHHLIHKAVGWMLREIGKQNQKIEEEFLKKNAPKIPRTTLRYAIEKFEEKKRKAYLNIKTKLKKI